MPNPPAFVTFTGVDNWTSLSGMAALARKYPIEWGILFSPDRQGVDPRYPPIARVQGFLSSDLTFSAHLCGRHSADIMSKGQVMPPVDFAMFHRVHVNHGEPAPGKISAFASWWGTRCAAQPRGEMFPDDDRVDWLYDASGGRGIVPERLPPYPGRRVGYAGGIRPDNVARTVKQVAATGPYWLDMETGVRTNDRFDLSLCERVCRAVYD